MSELGLSEVLTIAQTIGIVGTMILTLYLHRMGEMIIERPELGRVITDIQADRWSVELPFAYYVLYICSHAYDMRERRILNDNEWTGWLQWMKNCFQQGTIKEHWRRIESEKWFDPSFQNFINKELMVVS